MDVSIVTVNYKTPQLLHTCISSIYKHTIGVDFEIIVVDNNSEDESEELIKNSFPQVKWINSGFNAGTSIAYNIGVRNSIGEYVLILNSDTEFVENTIKITLDYYKELEKDNKVGMLGCQLKGYDGNLQFNSNLSFYNYKNIIRANPIAIKLNLFQYKMSNNEKVLLHNQNHESKWLGIAFGLMKTDMFTKDQMYFDEDIFMYSDDIEWCYRLTRKGYKHFFTTSSCILHFDGGSASGNFSGWRYGQIIISEWLGILKIYGRPYLFFCMILIFLNIILDNFFYMINKRKRNSEIKKMLILYRTVFFKYFPKILFYYSKRTSSSKEFLKFKI
jgi:GT2 family glycosyltransferase